MLDLRAHHEAGGTPAPQEIQGHEAVVFSDRFAHALEEETRDPRLTLNDVARLAVVNGKAASTDSVRRWIRAGVALRGRAKENGRWVGAHGNTRVKLKAERVPGRMVVRLSAWREFCKELDGMFGEPPSAGHENGNGQWGMGNGYSPMPLPRAASPVAPSAERLRKVEAGEVGRYPQGKRRRERTQSAAPRRAAGSMGQAGA